MSIVSFFDQFPEWNGQSIQFRGSDGYVSISDLNKAMGKRFSDWKRTKFATEMLDELSKIYRTSIEVRDRFSGKTPLIDRDPKTGRVFAHPAVALSYARSKPTYQARINKVAVDVALKRGQLQSLILEPIKKDESHEFLESVADLTFRTESIPFDSRLALPQVMGIYFVVERGRAVLYLGKSHNIRQRWYQHFKIEKLQNRRGLRIHWIEVGSNYETLSWMERKYIRTFNPPFNLRDS